MKQGRAFTDGGRAMKTLERILGIAVVLLAMVGSAGTGRAATSARFPAETILNDPSLRISAGIAHTCQINEGGTVSCWGGNASGQLGDPTLGNFSSPVNVVGLTGVVAVSAGGAHTCALLAGGTMRCWGAGGMGQLGNNSTVAIQSASVLVSGLSGAVAISAGGGHSCALIADGTVRCWGLNAAGQLGDNTTSNRPTPVAVVGLSGVVAISAGGQHTCAVLAGGTVRCWGFNPFGQLGDGTTTSRHLPTLVGNVSRAASIKAGVNHTCVLRADGTAQCWGLNSSGQLGDSSTTDRHAPVFVRGLANAVAITTGSVHTCALVADGTARCWGSNAFGQIGSGTVGGTRLQPFAVSSSLNNAVAISAGGEHTCALRADGSAKCWGSDRFGELGDGTFVIDGIGETPIDVLSGRGTFTARDIAAGRSHTCAVRANGNVACWGANDAGQVGDGSIGGNRLSPANLPVPVNVVGIAAGEAHTCAVLANGTANCWGLNSSGQLGNGLVTNSPRPVVVSGLTNAVAIAAGGTLGSSHTCALRADGTVWCWGSNNVGQLGVGNTTPSLVPVRVSGLADAIAIAVGESHSCALVAVGAAFCWGSDGVTSHLVPTLVSLDNVAAIAGGNRHSCALRADGTAWCWGQNLLGQLGNGGTVSTATPTLVTPLFNAVSIAGGFGHSCASLADGTAHCWGDNAAGQLGDTTTTSSKTPTLVQGSPIFGIGTTLLRPLRNAVTVTAGRRHSCALTVGGLVACWGENAFGQLGNNSTVNSSVIVTVPSFALNIDPTVTLHTRNGRVTDVTVLANCEEGQWLHVSVTLTQGAVSGQGVGAGQCTGALTAYEVTVPAHGRDGFDPGPAVVTAHAAIQAPRAAAETQEWTRQVTIAEAQ
jgi:alpha-tubulin suppressor-like RCC1 family protein